MKNEARRGWHPLLSLSVVFLTWKAVLFFIALTSPGPGYDTSTTLLDFSNDGRSGDFDLWLSGTLSKFVRWDAIYYTHLAHDGHIYEQEWAFGNGLSTVINWTARTLSGSDSPTLHEITDAGILISHISHWGSVMLIWVLASVLNDSPHSSSMPVVAGLLHVLSPAGLFLSAPYSESLFAFLSLLGLVVYAKGKGLQEQKLLRKCLCSILAGAIFGLSAMIRSNGILGGILYLIDALQIVVSVASGNAVFQQMSELFAVICGGLLVGLGFLIPQVQAYVEYCWEKSSDKQRPWCQRMPPSIFTFVQSHYWNVGPFRYWTLSNLPLFLLAVPVLFLMLYSAVRYIAASPSQHFSRFQSFQSAMRWRLAVSQLLLALLAITSYHVQIIMRIASGYPLWYIWLASEICRQEQFSSKILKGVFRWMVMYAMIQGGLYACFLPPA